VAREAPPAAVARFARAAVPAHTAARLPAASVPCAASPRAESGANLIRLFRILWAFPLDSNRLPQRTTHGVSDPARPATRRPSAPAEPGPL
jgi:hypothetical protein